MTSSPIAAARSQYLLDLLAQVPDPRKRRGRRHPLAGLLAVGIAAVIAGSRSFAAIGQWAADAGEEVLAGLEQETWALLTLYQLLRMAMVTAAETRPGADPDRASFTTAMEAARDQLTAAGGICPDGPADLPGAIGRAVLATLLPARRPRYSARKVKCATSRYLNRATAARPIGCP